MKTKPQWKRRKRPKISKLRIERTQNMNDFFFTEEDSKGHHVRRQSDNKRMSMDSHYVYNLAYFYANREYFKTQGLIHKVRKIGK